MNESINKKRTDDNYKLDIPSFMLSEEYERRRRRRIEEERQKNIDNNRYIIQRDNRNVNRIAKRKKQQKVRAARILLSGMLVVVFATSLGINGLIQKKLEENNNQIIEIVEVDDAFESNLSIISPIPSKAPSNFVKNNIEEMIYNFNYEYRINNIPTNTTFSVGSSLTEYTMNRINNNPGYDYFIKYGEMFGIDPFILMAKGLQEASLDHNSCIPGGNNYNGYGVGICQLESPDGREIVAHNYLTGEDEVMYLTMENATNLEKNIKIGAMMFQNCLERCEGNLYLAIQSYNYSPGMMNLIISKYATTTGKNPDSIKNNLEDTGWLPLIRDVHDNPKKYVESWKQSTYGDENYIENVLRYFIGDKTYYYLDGVKYVLDFNTNQLIEIDNIYNKTI